MDLSLIDLSSDRRLGPTADVVRAVQAQTGDTPILLAGATARDILLTYAHGIAIARGTADIDFALATQNWRAFESVRASLIEKEDQHRNDVQLLPELVISQTGILTQR